MSKAQSQAYFWGAVVLIVSAAVARLIPHAPNFTPIAAMALFGAAAFERKTLAFAIPLLAMLLSDLALGFHDQMGAVYGSLILVSLLGFAIVRGHRTPVRIAAASVTASLVFFVVTNFAVWFQSGMYSRTTAGLIECYTLALPFLRNSAVGDLFFSGVLFAAWAFAERRISAWGTVTHG